MEINTLSYPETLSYNGPELRPHFILQKFSLRGSALVAFVGPCSVKTEHLVDWEDRLESETIEAAAMVHFLGEFFGLTLREGVLFQRLLIAKACEVLCEMGIRAERRGNDIFCLGRKLSVSIVTASPVSVLFHFGVNIDPRGAPVAAVGLTELGISTEVGVKDWANRILEAANKEWAQVLWACAKVRPVV